MHHIGTFAKLEEQMCLFTPSGEFQESPDRADALVWAITELMLGEHVTLGDAPVVSGHRRGSEAPIDDEEEDEGEWQRR